LIDDDIADDDIDFATLGENKSSIEIIQVYSYTLFSLLDTKGHSLGLQLDARPDAIVYHSLLNAEPSHNRQRRGPTTTHTKEDLYTIGILLQERPSSDPHAVSTHVLERTNRG